MTQDEYTIWTGLAINFTDETWEQIVSVAMLRLASFLCRESLPTDDQGNLPDALKMLLANFIAGVFKYQGEGTSEVQSKHVRNFTINFKTSGATNAFAQLARQYGDVIDMYSQCDTGFDVERSGGGFCCGCERRCF